MPLFVLFLVALSVAAIVASVAWRYPAAGIASPTPSVAAAQAVGRGIGHHSRLRRFIRGRLNPEVAAGLALTIALGVVLVGGLVIGVLGYLVRTNSRLIHFDASVAQWGADHGGPSERGLKLITQLGETWLVLALAVVVSIVAHLRRPNRWIPVFLLTVLVGQFLLYNGIKDLLDRARPTLNPIAETLGPSFPSGHTTTAAGFYAAAALVLGRGVRPHGRALLAGAAAGIAVAVACTRIFLDVHWLTDTIAGLFLGWAWFAACSVAFGGRFLSFGAGAAEAVHEADVEKRRVASRAAVNTTARSG